MKKWRTYIRFIRKYGIFEQKCIDSRLWWRHSSIHLGMLSKMVFVQKCWKYEIYATCRFDLVFVVEANKLWFEQLTLLKTVVYFAAIFTTLLKKLFENLGLCFKWPGGKPIKIFGLWQNKLVWNPLNYFNLDFDCYSGKI